MPITLPCPSCQKTLRAPDNAVGKKIRCPSCQTVVAVPAPEEEVFETPDEEFEKPDEETSVTEATPPAKKAAWEEGVTASKKKKADDESYGVDDDEDEEEDDRPRKKKKKKRRYDDDFDHYGDMRPARRTDPHRGVMILVMGIVTLLFGCLCPIPCWIIGSVTLNMAKEDGQKMSLGNMDRSGQSLVLAGQICAIVGIGIGVINVILFVALKISGVM